MLAAGVYAVLAGFLGAAASLAAKLSLGAGYLKEMCETGVRDWISEETVIHYQLDATVCEGLHIPLRLMCGLLLFICNAVMWTFFSKALRYLSSTQATVTTTASNFIFSALLGYVIFGESHAVMWWVGICLTLLGLFILHGSSPQHQQMDVKKNECVSAVEKAIKSD